MFARNKRGGRQGRPKVKRGCTQDEVREGTKTASELSESKKATIGRQWEKTTGKRTYEIQEGTRGGFGEKER